MGTDAISMNSKNINNGFANLSSNQGRLVKKFERFKKLLSTYHTLDFDRVLIAGCGKGDEAFAFNKVFKTLTIGIDINLPKAHNYDTDNVKLIKADLCSIPNSIGSFPFIYCYHVLEHVEKPKIALKNLSHILADDGILFIGFPNRLRITPSYLYSNLNKPITEIIRDNIKDYWNKIVGRFKNEFGAHAGFSDKEFMRIARPYFRTIIPLRTKWIDYQYPKYSQFFHFTDLLGISSVFYPSIYFIVRK